MTQEENIQDGETNTKHQRASRKRRALRFVCTAIGELEVFQEQVHRYQLPPMEEICYFCQAVKWKDETANICYSNGKVVLAPLYNPPQEFKHMLEDPLFLLKIRPYNSIFSFTCMGASLAKNDRIDEKLARARRVGVQGIICHRVGTLLPVESRTSSSSQLYAFDSDLEAQEKARCCIMDCLDREIYLAFPKSN
jgi:hypothetical protein